MESKFKKLTDEQLSLVSAGADLDVKEVIAIVGSCVAFILLKPLFYEIGYRLGEWLASDSEDKFMYLTIPF